MAVGLLGTGVALLAAAAGAGADLIPGDGVGVGIVLERLTTAGEATALPSKAAVVAAGLVDVGDDNRLRVACCWRVSACNSLRELRLVVSATVWRRRRNGRLCCCSKISAAGVGRSQLSCGSSSSMITSCPQDVPTVSVIGTQMARGELAADVSATVRRQTVPLSQKW